LPLRAVPPRRFLRRWRFTLLLLECAQQQLHQNVCLTAGGGGRGDGGGRAA